MTNYKKVYFRINTPSYYKNKYGVGFESNEDGEIFQKSITELFLNDGWEIKKERFNGGCNSVMKDKQELYLHPQSISGAVLEEDISKIENVLSNNGLFKFEKTDIYESLFDMTDEEYLEMLKSMSKEIKNSILKFFKTKKSNLYVIDTWGALQTVLNNYSVKRITKMFGRSSSDLDYIFISEIFENLVNEGKIITAQCQSGKGYKTVDYNDTKILYKNEGTEQETVCKSKSLNSILKKLMNCSWITDVRVVDNMI